MIKKEFEKIAKRYDKVMNNTGYEHFCILDEYSEFYLRRDWYLGDEKLTIKWLKESVENKLYSYYDEGNARCYERHYGKEEYKIWVAETGYLTRLRKALEKYNDDDVIEEE